MRQLQKLPLEDIFHQYSQVVPTEQRGLHELVLRHGIGVTTGIGHLMFHRLIARHGPFLLEDYRMGMVERGSFRVILNLQEHVFTEGTLVFVTPGTIVEPISVADNFLLEGMGLPADAFLMAHQGRLPDLFNGQMKDGHRMTAPTERRLIHKMLHLLHDLLDVPDTDEEVILSMVATIGRYYDQVFRSGTEMTGTSHATDTFNRFLRLVNLHCRQQHKLAFYADKLCITDRYLGTVVKQTSGVGAKDWIDRALIATAKVKLRHSELQIAQIADELSFPNASFFCKYFKRLTGLTPQQYRSQKD